MERDIRDRLVREAHGYLVAIDHKSTTDDGALDGLIRTAFGDPGRLRAAAAQLRTSNPDATDALDLLGRAVDRAESSPESEKPRPVPRPAAPEVGAG